MDAWTQLISTVGFPIACVCALGYFVYIAWNKITEQGEKREEKLYDVLAKAQANNEMLADTNREFVAVLETYKTDITEIKHDIEDIKDIIVKEN